MTDQVFCGECGTPVPSGGKFCPSCGARQESFAVAGDPPGTQPASAAPPPTHEGQWPPQAQAEGGSYTAQPPGVGHGPAPGPQQPPPYGGQDAAAAARRAAQQAARRVESVQPGAGELAAQLGQQLSTPGVVVGAVAGAVALAACLVAGLVLAVITPSDSFIGVLGADEDILEETLRLAVGTTMARFGGEGLTSTIVPVIFLAVPLGASAVAAYLQAGRTAGMGAWSRLLWPMGAGLVLAVPMLILALVAGGDSGDFSAGSVLLCSLLWGSVGAFVGTWFALRRSSPEILQGLVPRSVALGGRAVGVPLRSLGLLLAVTGVIGLALWEVQSLRDEPAAVGGRDVPVALIENLLLTGEWAMVYTGLGVFSEVTPGAVPVDTTDLDLSLPDPDGFGSGEDATSAGSARIFAFSDAFPPYVFVPGLVVLILLPIVAALYAGFATARAMASPTPVISAGWGALVGIVWALALVIVRAIGGIEFVIGESLFGGTLLVGTAMGALGGLLAGQGGATPGQTASQGSPYGPQAPYPGMQPDHRPHPYPQGTPYPGAPGQPPYPGPPHQGPPHG